MTFAGKSVCTTSRKVENFYNQSMLLSTPFNNFFYFNYLYQNIVPDAKKIKNKQQSLLALPRDKIQKHRKLWFLLTG